MIHLCSDAILLQWVSGCGIFGGPCYLHLQQMLPLADNDTILRKRDNHRPSDTVSRSKRLEILATTLQETHFSFYYFKKHEEEEVSNRINICSE